MTPNSLYLGDNLPVLRGFPDESVDLIYLDPPFNSKRDYNYVFRSEAGADDTAHVKAFSDTWSFEGAAQAHHELLALAEPVSMLMGGLRETFGETSLLGYLSVMALRLRELRRVLKPTGSLYLHCDETASHYLKLVLDAVFGQGSVLNELVWKRTFAHAAPNRWGRVHDLILFCRRGRRHNWNNPTQTHDAGYVEAKYRHRDERGRYRLVVLTAPGVTAEGASGQAWRGYDPSAAGRHWAVPQDLLSEVGGPDAAARLSLHEQLDLLESEGLIRWPTRPRSGAGVPECKRYLREGAPVQDVITDIPPINSQAAERLGYPTQKPLALLERIIAASSNPGDLVLDPFCGCGTAVAAAEKLGRQWVGIDITPLAITLIRKRMMEHFPDAYPDPKSIPVHGLPEDVAGARMLAIQDRYAFEQWALQLLGAAPAGGGERKKRGADRGIDGIVTWLDGRDKLQRCLISVKSGHVTVSQVRDLVGTVQREGAAMGVLITLESPTGPMLREAAGAGRYSPEGLVLLKDFPRIQVLTVDQLLEGPGPDLPRWRSSPHKEARVIDRDEQPDLGM